MIPQLISNYMPNSQYFDRLTVGRGLSRGLIYLYFLVVKALLFLEYIRYSLTGMFDKFHDECGLMAIWGHPEAANLAYLGLYSQQHRGQEGAGVVSLQRDKKHFSVHRGLGLVSDVFSEFDFSSLPGDAAVGHVRYTTAGGNKLSNVQPMFSEVSCGNIAVAHNGNLINAEALKKDLISKGSIFASTSDSELFLHLIARGKPSAPLLETLTHALMTVKGAYSLLILFEDRMYLVRDPAGLRPLAIGMLDGAVVAASETCAFDLIGAKYLRDVEPGEIVEISGNASMKSYFPFGNKNKPTPCIFEYVYFSRPDSKVFEKNVYQVRKRMGAHLAREHPVSADLVIPVPDSGTTAALGFAHEAGLPLELGLIRNHYVGRTFIEPKQSIRDFGVKIKLNANPEIIQNKSVVVVDDSIVRGTTVKKLIQMIRSAGAREVHLRISAPPTTDPCYYGIDTPDKSQLIAARMSVEEIRRFIGADSLGFLSLEGLYLSTQEKQGSYCNACFSGEYPLGTPDQLKDRQQVLL